MVISKNYLERNGIKLSGDGFTLSNGLPPVRVGGKNVPFLDYLWEQIEDRVTETVIAVTKTLTGEDVTLGDVRAAYAKIAALREEAEERETAKALAAEQAEQAAADRETAEREAAAADAAAKSATEAVKQAKAKAEAARKRAEAAVGEAKALADEEVKEAEEAVARAAQAAKATAAGKTSNKQ